jgi:pimeloyl-ACP methyl ester carboxylesterase
MDENSFLLCEGNQNGRTLVFIHGWPDDHRVWDKQIEHFAPREFCARVRLPNSGSGVDIRGGLDFHDLTGRICAAIDRLCQERGREQVILIGHDWGAYLAYLVEQARPERVDRMVTLDIGGGIRVSAKEAALICAYQWPLILAWLAGRVVPPLGDRMTERVARAVGAPLDQREAPLGWRQNYFYYYLWRGMLLPPYRKRLLRRYRPKCPLLYLYGLRKPVMFHSTSWLRWLDETPGCRQLGIDAGHWLQLTRPDEVNREMDAFLSGSDPTIYHFFEGN